MFAEIEASMGAKIEKMISLKSAWTSEIISLQFENDTQRYVVKTYGGGKNAQQNILREWSGLNFLYRANYPVPKPILHDLGSETPYLLMEEIDGQNLWTVYEKASRETQQKLLTSFIRLLFDLHALDSSIAGDPFAAQSTADFIEQELREIENRANQNGIENLAPTIAWLHQEKAKVSAENPSILHRDYHPWNVVVDTKDKAYVIDLGWGIGDYRFDLAWLCTLMDRTGLDGFSQVAWIEYQALRQGEIRDFAYFKVLATLRWLISVIVSLKTVDALKETKSRAAAKASFAPLIRRAVTLINEITLQPIEILDDDDG